MGNNLCGMKRRIRLTESDLRGLVEESIRKILREGIFDPDDGDNDIFDVRRTGKYRVTWDFIKNVGYHDWEDIDWGDEVVNSKEEAQSLVDELKRKYSGQGVFAKQFRIERLIITLSDDRWDTVLDMSNGYVGSKREDR